MQGTIRYGPGDVRFEKRDDPIRFFGDDGFVRHRFTLNPALRVDKSLGSSPI